MTCQCHSSGPRHQSSVLRAQQAEEPSTACPLHSCAEGIVDVESLLSVSPTHVTVQCRFQGCTTDNVNLQAFLMRLGYSCRMCRGWTQMRTQKMIPQPGDAPEGSGRTARCYAPRWQQLKTYWQSCLVWAFVFPRQTLCRSTTLLTSRIGAFAQINFVWCAEAAVIMMSSLSCHCEVQNDLKFST